MTENRKPFPLSHSRISAYDCGFYFANEYWKHIHNWLGIPLKSEPKPKPVGINAECGRFGHEVIAGYTHALIDSKLQSDLEAMKIVFQKEWIEGENNLPESEYDDLEWALTNFAETHLFNPQQIYGVEMRLAFRKYLDTKKSVPEKNELYFQLDFCDWNYSDVWFRGIIDLCETPDPETVIITDYKFSWAAQAKWELEKGLQGRIYAWLMSLVNPGAQNFIIRFDFVRKGIVVQLEYSRDDCEKMGERIKRISGKVEQAITQRGADLHNWPASLCSNCAWCQYQCPLSQNSLQLWREIKQREDAEQLAHLVLMQKQTLEKNQAQLKEYLKDEKPIAVDGQVFGYHVTETETYDPFLVHERLVDDFDPWEIMKVDIYKLNAKKREAMKEAVLDLAEIKRTQRYGIKKLEETNE